MMYCWTTAPIARGSSWPTSSSSAFPIGWSSATGGWSAAYLNTRGGATPRLRMCHWMTSFPFCSSVWRARALAVLLLATGAWADHDLALDERQALSAHLKTAVAAADSFADRYDAEVWLLDMATRLEHFISDPGQRLELLRTLHREASAAGLRPDLVLAVIEVESRFDPRSEEHTSELQSRGHLVCRLLLEKKKG